MCQSERSLKVEVNGPSEERSLEKNDHKKWMAIKTSIGKSANVDGLEILS